MHNEAGTHSITDSIHSETLIELLPHESLPQEQLCAYPLERNRKAETPKSYIGIDLHSDNIVYCVLQEERDAASGAIRAKKVKRGRVSCKGTDGIAAVTEALRPYCEDAPHFVVVEATYNWYWLANLFEDEGWFLRLADPCTVSQANLKHADDHTDAAYLADRLRLGGLKTFPIMGKTHRAVRDLDRALMETKTERGRLKTIVINEITNHASARIRLDSLLTAALKPYKAFRNEGGAERRKEYLSKLEEIAWQFMDQEANAIMLMHQLERILELTAHVDEISEKLSRMVKDTPEVQALQTIRGCGPVLSTIIATEIGDIHRFKTAKNFQSYCRLAPTAKLSNGKSKGLGNAKNGNAYLSWAMTELAHLMCRFNPEVNAEFQRLLARSGNLRVKAIRSLAAKISRAIFHMLRDGESFDVHRCFAPRKA